MLLYVIVVYPCQITINILLHLRWAIDCTFCRKALGEAFCVLAIIINHVILLHPVKSLLACVIEFLREPRVAIIRIRVTGRRTRSWRPDASINGVVVSVRSCERSLWPVRFYEAASRRPVIGVPETWVYSHRLALEIRYTKWLTVLELSNGCAINIEAGKENEKVKNEQVPGQRRNVIKIEWVETYIIRWRFQRIE